MLSLASLSLISTAAELGEEVVYENGCVRGVLLAKSQVDSIEYWTVQLDAVQSPLVAPDRFFYSLSEAQGRCDGPQVHVPVVPKSRPLRISKALVGSDLFKEVRFITPTSFLLDFRGYSVPILVKSVGKNITELSILGKHGEEVVPCLRFQANLESGRGDLFDLKTRLLDESDALVCPLPMGRRGSYLLALVDSLSNSLGLSETHLLDESEITCPKSGRTTSLQLLKVIREGKGWYEKNCYLPSDFKEYRKRVRTLRDYSLKRVEQEVLNSQTEFEKLLAKSPDEIAKEILSRSRKRMSLFQTHLKLFREEHSSDELAAFLSWVWDQDSAAYIKIFDHFIKARSEVGRLCADLGGNELIKYYKGPLSKAYLNCLDAQACPNE